MGSYYSNGTSVSYYDVLGIGRDASISDIRSAYRKLALKWHPDRRRSREAWLIQEAKARFQQIQEAYHVLGDEKKRWLYDAGLYDPLQEEEEEEEEGCDEFTQEMMSLMREERQYNLEELQQMFVDMAQDFNMFSQPQYW